MQNDTLATGIMSFVLHEVIYFGRCLPWMIIDRIPYFNKYKIQNVRPNIRLDKDTGKPQQLTPDIAKNTDAEGAMGMC